MPEMQKTHSYIPLAAVVLAEDSPLIRDRPLTIYVDSGTTPLKPQQDNTDSASHAKRGLGLMLVAQMMFCIMTLSVRALNRMPDPLPSLQLQVTRCTLGTLITFAIMKVQGTKHSIVI
jgi:hypothetical protein